MNAFRPTANLAPVSECACVCVRGRKSERHLAKYETQRCRRPARPPSSAGESQGPTMPPDTLSLWFNSRQPRPPRQPLPVVVWRRVPCVVFQICCPFAFRRLARLRIDHLSCLRRCVGAWRCRCPHASHRTQTRVFLVVSDTPLPLLSLPDVPLMQDVLPCALVTYVLALLEEM